MGGLNSSHHNSYIFIQNISIHVFIVNQVFFFFIVVLMGKVLDLMLIVMKLFLSFLYSVGLLLHFYFPLCICMFGTVFTSFLIWNNFFPFFY